MRGRRPSREGHSTHPPRELSATARALVAQPLAPGSSETLQKLRDCANPPQIPYAPPDPELLAFRPREHCALPLRFLASLRTAPRGSAAGPSGITNEHSRILLNDEADRTLLHCGRDGRLHADYSRIRSSIRAYARACSSTLEYARVCWSMLEYVRVRSSMLEYAQVCSSTLEYARVVSSMLEHAPIFSSTPEWNYNHYNV